MTISEEKENIVQEAQTSYHVLPEPINNNNSPLRTFTYKFSEIDDIPPANDPIICLDKSPPLICLSKIDEIQFREFIGVIEDKLTKGIDRMRDLQPKYIDKCIFFGFGCCPCTLGISSLIMMGYFFKTAFESISDVDPIKVERKNLQKEIQSFIDKSNEEWTKSGLKWRGNWVKITTLCKSDGEMISVTKPEFQLELEVLLF